MKEINNINNRAMKAIGIPLFIEKSLNPSLILDWLPEDVKDYFLNWSPLNDDSFWFPTIEMRMLGYTEALLVYDELKSIYDPSFEIEEDLLDHSGAVRDEIFTDTRFPIAVNEISQIYLFVDTNPGQSGTSGQIIANIDSIKFTYIARNFAQFLQSFDEHLNDNVLVFDNGISDRWSPICFDADKLSGPVSRLLELQ